MKNQTHYSSHSKRIFARLLGERADIIHKIEQHAAKREGCNEHTKILEQTEQARFRIMKHQQEKIEDKLSNAFHGFETC